MEFWKRLISSNRKKAEGALRASERRFRALIENSSEGITLNGADGAVHYVSPSIHRILGYPEEELLGKDGFDFVHPEDREGAFHLFTELLQHPGKTVTDQYRARHKDGSFRWIESTTTNLLADPDVRAIVVNYRDVTERKRNETLLRFHADILKNVRDGVIATDVNQEILYWNEGASSIYGYSAEEMLGQTPKILYASEEIYQEYLKKILERSGDTGVQERVRKDGTRVWVDLKVTPMLDAAGQAFGFIGVAKDIGDRIRVEQALKDSEEQYRLLFENNPHPMWVYDRETLAFLAVNEPAIRHYGYSREEFLSMTIADICPEDDVPKVLDVLSEPSDNPLMNGLWKHRKKDGTVIEVEATAHSLTFDGKRGRLVLVNDVTEPKRAEEKLRESEARFRAMCNASPVGIFLTEPDGRCVYDNAAHMRMSGLTWEEAMDFGWVKSIHPEDRERSVNGWRAAVESNTPYVGVNRYLHDDGTVVWADVRTAPVRDADRLLGYVGVVQDITERRLAEEELSVSRQGLRDLATRQQDLLEEERTVIARKIHDELGQFLTGLKMDLVWVGGRLSKSQASLKEKTVSMAYLIDRIVESVRRISTELRPGILDDLGLEAAIEWQAHEFQDRTGIRTQFTSALGDAHLDRDLSTAAFRILQEALTNVARHANAKKVTIDLRELDGDLALMVEDNGVGIKSFEITDKQSLGILGMQERAHLLGGEVEIRGQEERGTTVALRIPLNQPLQIVKNHDQSSHRG